MRPPIASLLLAVSAMSACGQDLPLPGELAVTPPSVRFDDRTRQAEVYLQNTGSKQATYRISFQHFKMLASGELAETETLPNSAESLIRYSPRQVTLEAGERQVLRLQLRRPESLAEGEYRVHLLLRAVPPIEAPQPKELTHPEGLRVNLTAIPGVSVPIEVIHGNLDPSFGLEHAHLNESPNPFLQVELVQKGRVGLRGTLTLHAKIQGQRRYKEIASMDVVHYGDLPRQRIRFDIPPAAAPFRPLPDGPYALVLKDHKERFLMEIPVGDAHSHAGDRP